MGVSKNILMISGRFLPESYGGSENQCLLLSKALISRGYSITLLTSRSKLKTPKYGKIGGVNVIRFLTLGAPQYLSLRLVYASLFWFFQIFFWMRKNHQKYDIIHAHQAKFQVFTTVWMSKRFNKKSIVKIANGGNDFELFKLKEKIFFGKRAYKYVLNNVDLTVAISSEITKQLQSVGLPDTNIVMIPNGVECHEDIQKKFSESPEFVFTGRFEHQKNLLELVHSFSLLVKEFPKSRLTLVGDGSLRPALEELVESHQLFENIIFTGYLPEVESKILEADFFILPSLAEGMSNSLLEAMSRGLIPLSTPVSGASDLIANGQNGFLISGYDRTSIYEAMIKAVNLTSEQKASMSLKTREKIKSKNDIKLIASRYIELYTTILD